jgi:Ras-related protein Rab-21
LTPLYYRDANGAILVYDITVKETFKKVEKWIEELKIFNNEIEIITAGNKSDIGKYDIDKEEIKYFCESFNTNNFFTSAKTGEGLNEVFEGIFNKLAERFYTENKTKKKGLSVAETDKDDTKEKGCC